ncbi:MAG: M23 family metallopeptidase [Chloroflexi bacterium]|nr:M23 family metallopeptidase [Chloroflexota bacterium]
MFAKSLRAFGSVALRYRAHIFVDVAVASMVLTLPLSLRTEQRAANAPEPPAQVAALATDAELVRASTVSRGGTITPGGNPATRVADDVKPIQRYMLGAKDTLQSLGNYYGVSAEAIAVSNGISDPSLRNQQGREIMIPPGEGVLYTVAEGDTVESVATKFKVDPKVIMDYNRLYFEPEHFAPAQLVFVPGASLPTLVYQTDDEEPTVIARPPSVNNPRPNGRLAWPVGGYISQYFWAFHSGVDLAAPYGTGIGASGAGTVVSTGWVAVGGLSVRIKHEGGFETGYYHMGAVYVAPGQKVERGQIIGTVGMTGITTGPHVHWELKLNGAFVNPLSH